jgi:hypothetical protein
MDEVDCETAEREDVMGEVFGLNRKVSTITFLDGIEVENMK